MIRGVSLDDARDGDEDERVQREDGQNGAKRCEVLRLEATVENADLECEHAHDLQWRADLDGTRGTISSRLVVRSAVAGWAET